MSFGFSVGDVIAVSSLIAQIANSLKDAGGAKSDYQELVRELENLDRALKHIDKLRGPTADSIKCAALMCQYPLLEFLNKIGNYEKTLGVTANNVSFAQATVKKMQWSFGKKDEVAKLRDYLSLHIGSINMQLLISGLETLAASSGKADGYNQSIKQELEQSRKEIANLGSNAQSQTILARATNNTIGRLFAMVRGDVIAPIKELLQAVTRVCASTQQIYCVLLEIRAINMFIDTKRTYFQAPLRVEDALGRIWPVPSEYSVNDLHAIVQSKFLGQPGEEEIKAGNYELFQQQDSQQIISADKGVTLLPGMHITMAVVLQFISSGVENCPITSCGSSHITTVPGGGRKCEVCGVWFDETSKKRKRTNGIISDLEEEESYDEDDQISAQEPRSFKRPKKILRDSSPIRNKVSANPFKNLKVSRIPDLSTSRIWTDSTGNFQIEARYLDMKDGKVRLHKSNGVKIAVQAHKMSLADLKLIEAFHELSANSMGVDPPQIDHWDPWSGKLSNVFQKAREYPTTTRMWRDRSGEFEVEAAFIALLQGKVHLHKKNGVKIKVPMGKMSFRDLAFVEGCLNENVADEERDALWEELRLSQDER